MPVLGPGIKLLVRAKPTFHEVYGLSLVIDAIDPDYTLGDLEARKKEIRARLQREGVFDRNKQLQRPWDYRQVLVLAPQSAAGLGDFRAESDRLERLAICGFTYLAARFQGEGAPAEMLTALATGLERWQATRSGLPDALVIIRGGGPANDLAWLNDYRLARWICECPVPVLTGIGHERDSTVLDEVCHQCFDTPSKVIHGIETVIKQRVAEAKTSFEQIQWQAHRTTQAMQRVVIQTQALVRERARAQLDSARHRASEDDAGVRLGALRALKLAVARVAEGINEVREFALGNRSRAWLARSLSRRAGTAGPRTTTLSCAAPSWRSSRVGR